MAEISPPGMKPSLWYACAFRAWLAALFPMLMQWVPANAAEHELYSKSPVAVIDSGTNSRSSCLSTENAGYRTYDSFEIDDDVQITKVTWVGHYFRWPEEGPVEGATDSWELSFHANSGGQPGALLRRNVFAAGNVSKTFLYNSNSHGFVFPVYRWTATLPAPLDLESGTPCWLSVVSLQQDFHPVFAWWPTDGPGSTYQEGFWPGYPDTTGISPTDRAFAIIGDVTAPSAGISLAVNGTTVASGGNASATPANLGTERQIQIVITNPGEAQLTNISASVTAGSPAFRLGPTPPASTLNPGSPTAFIVIFTPQGLGDHSGTVQVTSSADPSPYIIHFTVSGTDSSPPLISPQASVLNLVDGAAGNSTTLNNWLQAHGGASATDNSGSVTWTHDFTALPPIASSTTITFTARDAAGNEATTTAAINVLDQTPPTINAPATDLQVVCDDPDRAAQITAWLASQGGASATDNSGSFTWSHNYSTEPGPCGNVTVTFTAKDPSNNSSTASAKIFVLDNTAPAIGTPAANLTVESNGNGNTVERNVWLNNHGGATATDSCSGVSWSHSFTSLANNLPQTVPVTFTARDSCSNPSVTSANFIIQDTTPPQITTAASDYYGDQHEAAADIATFLNSRGGAQAVDIAGPVTWSHNFNGTPPPIGGYTIVTFTATDTVGLSVSTTCRLFLFPPGAVWIGPADSFWSIPQNWRIPNGVVPDSSRDCYVDLFDFQNTHTTLNGNYGVKNLYIGAGDEVDLDGSITVYGTLIRNDGIYRSHRVTDLEGGTHALSLNGPVSLEGSGKLYLNNAGRNTIYYTSEAGANGILTVGAQQEISTAGATSGGYQGTSIHAGLFNHGTVSANGGGLNFYALPKANRGTFRAINGGYLEVQVPVDNTGGTVLAGPASTVLLQQTLTGGTVSGTGTMLVNASAGLTGPVLLESGLNTSLQRWPLTLTGTITNDGLIQFGVDANTPAIHLNGPVTLNGTGKVKFQGLGRRQILAAVNGNTDILTIGAQQELTTDHLTDSNYQSSSIHAGIVNDGTVTANQGQLSLYNFPKTNHGLMRAINGGFLHMQANVINTGATLFAGPGSTLYADATITGGTITGTGELLFASTGDLVGPITLDAGLTTNLDNQGLGLTGDVNLNGVLNFGSDTSTATCSIYVNGPVNLQGSGKVIFRNAGRRQILYGSGDNRMLTIGPDIEVTTDSRTGLNYQSSAIHAPITNYGTVTVNGGGLTIYNGPKTNHGTFRAINGGYMDFTNVTVTNYNAVSDTLSGGRWEVVSNGTATTMDFSSSPIVTITAGTTVRLSGATASIPQLSSLATMGGTLILENGNTLARSGNLAIPGVLEYGLPAALETTRLAVTGNINFTGTTIHIRDLGLTSGSYLLASWTGSVTGAPTLGSLPSGSHHTLVLDPVAKTLRLQVTVIPPVEVISFTTTPADESGPDAGKRHVHLSGQGQPDTDYRVHASADLELWVPVSEVLSSPTGALEWEFLQEPGFPQRFYRFEPE